MKTGNINIPHPLNKSARQICTVLRKKADKIVDKLGTPMDEGIKETVIALWLHGFPTISSCEGHFDQRGLVLPVVFIYPKRPRGFSKEMDTFGKDFSLMEINLGFPNYPLLKKTAEECIQLKIYLGELLSMYYEDHQVQEDVKLIFKPLGFVGDFTMSSQFSKQILEKSILKQKEVLKVYQDEMFGFGNFLHNLACGNDTSQGSP